MRPLTIFAAALTSLTLGCGAQPTGKPSSPARPSTNRATTHRPGGATGLPDRAALAATRRLARAGRPVYCGGGRRREVALTFDDGPGPYTHFALRKLRRHRSRATFFVVGRNLPRFPDQIPGELAAGGLGDHTFTHPYLPALSAAAQATEIDRTQKLITAAAHTPTALFRPPYGGRNAAIDAEARARGLLEVVWNVDTRDSEGASYRQIGDNAIAGLRPGAIILMHENRGQTIRALPRILEALRRQKLRAVTVPEMMRDDPPSPRQLALGPRGCS